MENIQDTHLIQPLPTINNVVYISNIPRKTRKEELSKILIPYGSILSLNIIYRGEFAFAFAQFDDMRDAAQAVKELNQTTFQRRKLRVQFKNKNKNNLAFKVDNDSKKISETDSNRKQEKQCQTQISLGLQKQKKQNDDQVSHKEVREKSISSVQYHERSRSRQKKRKRQNKSGRTFQQYQKSEDSQINYPHQQKLARYRSNKQRQKKMIQVPEQELDEIAEDIMFIQARLSRVYEKIDRLIYKGRKKNHQEKTRNHRT